MKAALHIEDLIFLATFVTIAKTDSNFFIARVIHSLCSGESGG